jgi:hypothetical protein
MRQNDQLGVPAPAADGYCYRTLGEINCYTQPNKQEAARLVQ